MTKKLALAYCFALLIATPIMGVNLPDDLCYVEDCDIMSFSVGNPEWIGGAFTYKGAYIAWYTYCSSGTRSVCQSCVRLELWRRISSNPEVWELEDPSSPFCDSSDLQECDFGGYAFSPFQIANTAPLSTYKIKVFIGPCANHSGCIETSMFADEFIFTTTMPPGGSSEE